MCSSGTSCSAARVPGHPGEIERHAWLGARRASIAALLYASSAPGDDFPSPAQPWVPVTSPRRGLRQPTPSLDHGVAQAFELALKADKLLVTHAGTDDEREIRPLVSGASTRNVRAMEPDHRRTPERPLSLTGTDS